MVGASQERWEDASLEFMERGVPGGPSASQRCRANGMDEYDVDVPGVNGRVWLLLSLLDCLCLYVACMLLCMCQIMSVFVL